MVRTCQDLRDAVALCLQRSECVMVQRNSPKKCLEDPELARSLPESCIVQIFRYMECKRGQIDRSKRFRGNGPASTGQFQTDLQLIADGNFDPSNELNKLSGQHVEAKAKRGEN